MLEDLFGSSTAAKCLLFINADGESYPSEISKSFGISNTQVIRTLNRLEQADILVGRVIGRSRLYDLNKQWWLYRETRALLDKALRAMPLKDQERYFMKRRRPRKKLKAL